MKNSEYRQLQKRLIFLFLLLSVLVLGGIFVLIATTNYYASLYASQSLLSDSDFLMFYLNYSWEINTFLFVGALTLLLYGFLSLFFHNMNVLLKTLQGEQKRTP
ncbi:MAG: sensor histidine kinase, partial [Longicatena sp.]